LQSQNGNREKLHKALLYQKLASKMLMKLTTGRLKKGIARGFASLYVNFLNEKSISLPFTADDFADRIRNVSLLLKLFMRFHFF
jgi:hypothetical protein